MRTQKPSDRHAKKDHFSWSRRLAFVLRGIMVPLLHGGPSLRVKAEVAWAECCAQYPFTSYNLGKGSLPTLGEAEVE